MKKSLHVLLTLFVLALTGPIFILACNPTDQKKNKALSTIIIGSYNLRFDFEKDGENAWPHRKEMVKGLIRFHDFDIIGTQEGLKHQLDDILELENWSYIGGGRDDGKDAGEHAAILYNNLKYEVIENGDFWFSETADVPSKGWDATCCNRICSWAKFLEKESGKQFFFFNSHYDHRGQVARKNSSLMLLEKVSDLSGDYPIIITGDFNATPEKEPIQIIYNSGILNDSYLVTEEPPYGTVGTYNAFKIDAPMDARIDYIWVTPDIEVKKYGVLNEIQYGRYGSDHFPVIIKAKF